VTTQRVRDHLEAILNAKEAIKKVLARRKVRGLAGSCARDPLAKTSENNHQLVVESWEWIEFDDEDDADADMMVMGIVATVGYGAEGSGRGGHGRG
jgi:hypothetical protein